MGGAFDNEDCLHAKDIIKGAIANLRFYSHQKLIPELGFGFWRYLFAPHQFAALGKKLLQIFPSKPQSSPSKQYNVTYIQKKLAYINTIRNRIAHHEPICFGIGNTKNTSYARQNYNLILQLFQWLDIDASGLLGNLDNVISICDEIDNL